MKKLSGLPLAIAAALICLILGLGNLLSAADFAVTDRLYSFLRPTEKDILIVEIDEATLDAYGSFTDWSREKIAELLDILYYDENNEPLVTAVDVIFQGERDPENDWALANACAGYDIVVTGDLVFSGTAKQDENGAVYYDSYHVEMQELPYPALMEVTQVGFANAFTGVDGVDRYSMLSCTANGETAESFAFKIAKIYTEKTGKKLYVPKTDANGLYRFFYAEPGGEYNHISFRSIMEGQVPSSEWKNKIVMVGAAAAGMQDRYMTTADTYGLMNGVEIQANLVQCFLDGFTAVPASVKKTAWIGSLLVLLIGCIAAFLPLSAGLVLAAAGFFGTLITGRTLAGKGLTISLLPMLIGFLILFFGLIIRHYVKERLKRKKVTDAFRQYMEPALVERLSKDDSFTMKLGGEKKDVAVLFVDIRGFTSMSENLQPEEIVQILNEYLGMVTDSVFRHHGMLDKFIGDAAMAVFNAPVDQEDYLYEAVAAACDIANGSEPLSKKLIEKYGRTVSFGIGVNLGPAVIGNIGCDFRMDYTAIGDTVNTASRLEGQAGRGEILISEIVKEKLGDRILTEDAGQLTLKGKAEPVQAYRVVGLK